VTLEATVLGTSDAHAAGRNGIRLRTAVVHDGEIVRGLRALDLSPRVPASPYSMPATLLLRSTDHRESIMQWRRVLTIAISLAVVCPNASAAADISVAVAANFSDAAKEIAALFKAKTGNNPVLSFGSSGQFYTQITQDAPFEILLSADEERPKKAIEDGFGLAGSRFTYATGKLVLWSRNPGLVKGEETLREGQFAKLAIANPIAAPYGAAGIETLKTLNLYSKLEPKLVQGNNIAQTFEFVETGNADLGFIAFSQLIGNSSGSQWMVPQALYAPIRQDAVLLKKGAANGAASAFLDFLKGPEARAIIEKYGYEFGAGQ
jgi:molybdate transport system substrate-binding protein